MNFLFETKSIRESRLRSYSNWQPNVPLQIDMVKAGWFLIKTEQNKIIAICPYCKSWHSPQNPHENPQEMHQRLAPDCVFHSVVHPDGRNTLRFNYNRRRPLRRMAAINDRFVSFDSWPTTSSQPSFERLASEGFYYTGVSTQVRCFCCEGEEIITDPMNDLNRIHHWRCTYHHQITGKPIDVQQSV